LTPLGKVDLRVAGVARRFGAPGRPPTDADAFGFKCPCATDTTTWSTLIALYYTRQITV
jgi:hypothetical protein